jgi:RNA polymerase primary sigma factor
MMMHGTTSFVHPFHSYLHEINDTPLLSAEEETALAWRVREHNDAEARDHLARANLRLVVNIARYFVGRGLAIEDLIAEGNLGLLRSVDGFDPTMGTRFSTYACYWIRQSIRRAVINTARTIRLPAYAVELMRKWRRASSELKEELGRAPVEVEIAGRLGLSARRLKILRTAFKIIGATSSLNGETGGLLPFLPSPGDGPDARLKGEDNVRQVLRLVDQLNEREATVVRLRFGLAGNEPMTLRAVGEVLGLTRERVRQLEVQALRSLRQALEVA